MNFESGTTLFKNRNVPKNQNFLIFWNLTVKIGL